MKDTSHKKWSRCTTVDALGEGSSGNPHLDPGVAAADDDHLFRPCRKPSQVAHANGVALKTPRTGDRANATGPVQISNIAGGLDDSPLRRNGGLNDGRSVMTNSCRVPDERALLMSRPWMTSAIRGVIEVVVWSLPARCALRSAAGFTWRARERPRVPCRPDRGQHFDVPRLDIDPTAPRDARRGAHKIGVHLTLEALRSCGGRDGGRLLAVTVAVKAGGVARCPVARATVAWRGDQGRGAMSTVRRK